MIRIRPRIKLLAGVLSAAVVLFSGTQAAWPQGKKDIRSDGLPNWGHVTDALFRGGQPNLAGFKALQQMGVGIIVNFRNEPDQMASEKREVESLGMKYISIPWSGRDNPSNAQVAQFLNLVRENSKAKIFVHCQRGADRTGVMIAAYRIAEEHKPVGEAVSEMHQFHYAHFWLPHLERYVKSLPELLQSDPLLSAYATTAPGPAASSKPVVPAVAAGLPGVAAVAPAAAH